MSLGFAIQAAETEKSDGAQPKQGGRGGFGNHAWRADGGRGGGVGKGARETNRRGRKVGRILGGGTPVVPNKRIGGNPSPSNSRVAA